MKLNHMRCPRCRGQKKMFKMGSGYSSVDSGGPKIDCPMCLGEGIVKTFEAALDEIKDVKNGEETKRKGRPKKSGMSLDLHS